MARQHAGIPGIAEISEGHKEVVNIRTAGAASQCSAANAIRIRPNSLKPLFGTPLHTNTRHATTSSATYTGFWHATLGVHSAKCRK